MSEETENFQAPRCCVVGCTRGAEFNIFVRRLDGGIAGPDIYSDDTQACVRHVGELLGCQPKCTASWDDLQWLVTAIPGAETVETQRCDHFNGPLQCTEELGHEAHQW